MPTKAATRKAVAPVTPITHVIPGNVGAGEKVSPRYKAVRRVKNVVGNHIESRIRLYTRSIAVAKDKGKIAILQGKIEALQGVKAVLAEV